MRTRIAVVARTAGLEYDDRIRKECMALQAVAEVRIFANFEHNTPCRGITSYGVPFEALRLRSRQHMPSGRMLLVKALEFYARVSPRLRHFDWVWAHEVYSCMFPLLRPARTCIWDQHEIPTFFVQPGMRRVFHLIERRCRLMVHANPHRIRYLAQEGVIRIPERHVALRNYPDAMFVNSAAAPPQLEEWRAFRGSRPCVYLQGLSSPGRYPFNSIAAVLEATDCAVFVAGRCAPEARNALQSRFGKAHEDRVYYAGMLEQLTIPVILREAAFSIVLYASTQPNNRFCEANRFYQAVVLGIPVICGANEPMREIVDDTRVGIALTSDGRDLQELVAAVRSLMDRHAMFRANARRSAARFMWNPADVLHAVGLPAG